MEEETMKNEEMMHLEKRKMMLQMKMGVVVYECRNNSARGR